MNLEWIQDGEYAGKTKCGRYFITQTMHGGAWWHSAFARKPATRLGKHESRAAAKAACVAHAGEV